MRGRQIGLKDAKRINIGEYRLWSFSPWLASKGTPGVDGSPLAPVARICHPIGINLVNVFPLEQELIVLLSLCSYFRLMVVPLRRS